MIRTVRITSKGQVTIPIEIREQTRTRYEWSSPASN